MWDRKSIKKAGQTHFLNNYVITVLVTVIGMVFLNEFKNIAPDTFLRELTDNLLKLRFPGALANLVHFLSQVVEIPLEAIHRHLGPLFRGEEPLTTSGFLTAMGAALLPAALGDHILHLAVDTLFGLPYGVGLNRYFLENRRADNAKLTAVFHPFRNRKEFWNILSAQIMRELITFLCKLVFLIPGIMHHYSLFCVPFIMAENPDLTWRHAHHLSEKMTRGYKWKLFCLEYSFLGWMILDVLSLHLVGAFYMKPRMHATFAEAYIILRKNALEKGLATEAELPGTEVMTPAV